MKQVDIQIYKASTWYKMIIGPPTTLCMQGGKKFNNIVIPS